MNGDVNNTFHRRPCSPFALVLRHKRLGDLPHAPRDLRLRDRFPYREPSRQHADPVAVDARHPPAERDRKDRPRGVPSDAGQRRERLRIGRHAAAMVADDGPRGRMQVHRAAIVPQALPDLENRLVGCLGEGLDGREPREKPLVVRDDRGNLRLLEHDLADPDAVRIGRSPPRQVAAGPAEPREQPAHEGAAGGRREAGEVAWSHCLAVRKTAKAFTAENAENAENGTDWHTATTPTKSTTSTERTDDRVSSGP